MWNKNLLKTSVFVFAFLCANTLFAQNKQQISYADFLDKLAKNNLEYAAEKYNLDIADAEIEAAKILPDPEISFSANDNQQRRMKMGYGFEAELEWDVELGGKRKARKKLAQEEQILIELELQQYFKKLRKKSTLSYLKSLQAEELYKTEKKAYEQLLAISKKDSARYDKEEIKKSVLVKSKLEAQSRKSKVNDAEDNWEYQLKKLRELVSSSKHDTIFIPQGNLKKLERVFTQEDLLQKAEQNQGKLQLSKQNIAVAHKKIDLEKAERALDLGLSIGVENNSFEKNIIGPTPGHTSVFAGISVPLQFSNRKDAGLKTAIYEEEQAQLIHQSKEIKLERQITRAYNDYENKQKKVAEYKTFSAEAKEAYEEEIENYLTDNSSYTDFLNAEETYLKFQKEYSEALYDYAEALIKLESKIGMWDIDF